MLLYEHPLSSYAQKVKIALREKGLNFQAEVPETLGTGRTDGPFAAANPRAEVPVLIDGPTRVFESTVIMEYIEERWPEPPLLPRDPAARAFARMTEDVCDTRPRPDEAAEWRGCLNRGGRHRAIRDRGYVRFAPSHIVSNIGSAGRETMPRTHVSHASEGAFQQVAPGISVRDLGIGDVTAGEFTAQVIRIEPEGAHVEALHQHEEGFSLAYVLKGWLDVEFEEIGVQHLGTGTVIPAFNGPVHRELDCGGGLELLLLVTQKHMRDEDRHRIFVQQERDAEYKPGLRDYFVYRDFGLEELTEGRMVAHAIKVLPGKHPHGQWHTHDLGFQFVYVADGWVEFDYEDIGKVRLEKGSAVYQPPKIRHAEVAHSDDVLILEVVTPGEFETKTVDAPAREPAEAK